LANWQFEVLLTDRAKADYKRLRAVAEAQVSLRPIPRNADSGLQGQLSILEHYDRTRKILKSLRDPPKPSTLERSLLGKLWYVNYRTDQGTSVYFERSVQDLTVTVVYISDSPLDYDAISRLVFSGRTHVLSMIGLDLPPDEIRPVAVQ
jgi:hypothetical protein